MKVSQLLRVGTGRQGDAWDDLLQKSEDTARNQPAMGLYETWTSQTKAVAREYVKLLDKDKKLAPQDGAVYVQTGKKIADLATRLAEEFTNAAEHYRKTADQQEKFSELFKKAAYQHKAEAAARGTFTK